MQTHAQLRRRPSKRGSLFAPRRVHEQARAGEDAVAMRFDDPAIDPAAGPEIISVDDRKFHGASRPAHPYGESPPASQPVSKEIGGGEGVLSRRFAANSAGGTRVPRKRDRPHCASAAVVGHRSC